ncbi:unnamed protein product, partial [Ectocarpus sp. 13 AM-2016]
EFHVWFHQRWIGFFNVSLYLHLRFGYFYLPYRHTRGFQNQPGSKHRSQATHWTECVYLDAQKQALTNAHACTSLRLLSSVSLWARRGRGYARYNTLISHRRHPPPNQSQSSPPVFRAHAPFRSKSIAWNFSFRFALSSTL